MKFLRADSKRVEILRKLAHDSEAYWGGSHFFMEVFDETFNITDHFIRENPVHIGIENDTVICFWGVIQNGGSCELEYFYIRVDYIKKGLGKTMWANLIEWCLENQINKISLVTSSEAKEFYIKMGCTYCGDVSSTIDGRAIPSLEYRIDSDTGL